MQATQEQLKQWAEYDYGHKKALRELGIDEAALPNEIKSRIRGFNLGSKKANSEESFKKLVTLSAAIGDNIVTWYEREGKDEEPPAPQSSGTEGAPASEKKTELTEEEVLAQHSGKGGAAGGAGGQSPSSEDGDGYFGWDDDE